MDIESCVEVQVVLLVRHRPTIAYQYRGEGNLSTWYCLDVAVSVCQTVVLPYAWQLIRAVLVLQVRQVQQVRQV
jgi:hypothetical protein